MGQTIYVPIYSSILFFDDRQTRELSAMLTIHNIDLDWQIEISRVDYYNTKGQYLRSYLREPRALAPLETITFVVEEMDRTGGVGANFIVVWQAPNEVSAPLVEAVMIGSGSLGNVSLITSGKVIRTFGTHHTPK